VLSWLHDRFAKHRTLVIEHDAAPKTGALAERYGAEHVFIKADGCFHKSRVFNTGIALAGTPYVLLYDCDVLFAAAALCEALEELRTGRTDCVYPYNGVMLQIRCNDGDPQASLDARCLSAAEVFSGAPRERLPTDVEYLHGTIDEPSAGGALMCDRKKLILMGGLNENIVSYGCEDTELETRLVKLGARLARLPERNCFHVHHRRGQDSHYNNFHSANLAEWRKVEAMSKPELERYVRNGFRRLRMDSFRQVKIVDEDDRFGILLGDPAGIEMNDVALAIVLPSETAFPPALVAAMIDDLDKSYDNFELHLFELGGNHYRPVSHRDHVLYRSMSAGEDWFGALTGDTDRRVLCLCTPFADTSPGVLLAAVGAIRDGAVDAREIASAPPPDTRTARLRETLTRVLPTGPRSFAFRREALAAELNRSGEPNRSDAPAERFAAAAESLGDASS
jgi:hypothetical protein